MTFHKKFSDNQSEAGVIVEESSPISYDLREMEGPSILNNLSMNSSSSPISLNSDTLAVANTAGAILKSPLELDSVFSKNYSCCGILLKTMHDLVEHYEKEHSQSRYQGLSASSDSSDHPSSAEQSVFDSDSSEVPPLSFDNKPFRPIKKFKTFDISSSLKNEAYLSSGGSSSSDEDTLELGFDNVFAKVKTVKKGWFYGDSGLSSEDVLTVSPASVFCFKTSGNGSLGDNEQQLPSPKNLLKNANVSFQKSPVNKLEDYKSNQIQEDFSEPEFEISKCVAGTDNEYQKYLNHLRKKERRERKERLEMMKVQQRKRKQILESQDETYSRNTQNDVPAAPPKKYSCLIPNCDRTYRNQNGLKYHISHAHTKQERELFVRLQKELKDDPTEKPYLCSEIGCEKRYRNSNGLKYHLLKCHGIQRSSCSQISSLE